VEPEGSFPHSHVPATCPYPDLLRSYQSISPDPKHVFMFRNKGIFYGEKLSAPLPTPKLDDHPLSAVCDCFFDMFVAALRTVGRSSIRNLRTRHAVATCTHLSRNNKLPYINICIRNVSRLYAGTLFIWQLASLIHTYRFAWRQAA